MKAIFKLIPVALGLLTVASCSNDELFGEKLTTPEGKVLQVSVEAPVDALTRAANTAEGNDLVWQEGDEIMVFDSNLFKYDPYDYSASSKAFVLKKDESAYLDEPAYALFPNRFFNSANTHWDRTNNQVYAIATIDRELYYGENHNGWSYSNAYLANGGNPAYVSNLPMWGTAAKDGETTSASLQYTTAILKVKLNNAMGNVKYLYVRGFKDIARTQPAQLSGEFKLLMSDTECKPLAKSKLVARYSYSLSSTNYLQIDISNINKATSVIYVPVPVGHYGKLDVWASNTKTTDPGKGTTDVSSMLIQEYTDKTFDVKFYATGNTKTYDVDASTPNKISALLNAAKDETSNVTIDGSKNGVTTASEEYEDGWYYICVPNMQADKVELKLKEIKGEPVTIGGDSFVNTFVLNMESNSTNITINLPNANVVLLGNYNSTNVNIYNAKSVTFGDGTTDTKGLENIAIRAEVYGPLTVAAKATTGDLTLPADHRIAEVTIDGTCGKLTVNEAAQNDCVINVNGTAGAIDNQDAGAITLSGVATSITNKAGDITINGAPNYLSTGNYAKVGDVTTNGNVTVALDNEGAAISGTLTLTYGKALTLTQGYVKTVTGPSEDKSKAKAKIALGASPAYIAVNTVTAGKYIEVIGTTKWNGEKIGGSIDTDAEVMAINPAWKTSNVSSCVTDWKNYADAATAVYTANGLAENAGAFTLANDIDLNNKAWTAVATTGEINGGGKTIKNLTVAVPADKADKADADAGLGLFSELNNKVSNLTLDGVTVDAKVYTTEKVAYTVSNIGALAGKTNAEVTLTNVVVKNINLQSAGQDKTQDGAKAIGGVIGLAGAKVTMNGVVVSGTNKITGYSAMGGLIGDAAGNAVTIAKTTVNNVDVPTAVSGVTFKNNHNSAKTDAANDVNYLKVGNFIGTTTQKGNQITMTDVTVASALDMASIIKPAYVGYTHYFDDPTFYPYVFAQGLIGYCGDKDLDNAPSINKKSYQMYNNKKDGTNANYNVLYYINK